MRAEPSRRLASVAAQQEMQFFSCVQKSGFVNPVVDVDHVKGGIANSVVARKVSLCVHCFAGQLRIFVSVVLLKVQISCYAKG